MEPNPSLSCGCDLRHKSFLFFLFFFFYNLRHKSIALRNANAKCKGNLAFQAPKCSASGNANAKYCKFFCNSGRIAL